VETAPILEITQLLIQSPDGDAFGRLTLFPGVQRTMPDGISARNARRPAAVRRAFAHQIASGGKAAPTSLAARQASSDTLVHHARAEFPETSRRSAPAFAVLDPAYGQRNRWLELVGVGSDPRFAQLLAKLGRPVPVTR
jgi:hypothetical protein